MTHDATSLVTLAAPGASPGVALLLLAGVALAGLLLDQRHRRGWFLRGDELPRRTVPRYCLASATVVVTVLLVHALPHHTATARAVLALHLLVAVVTLALAAVDVAVHRLPDVLTLPLAATVLLGFGVLAATSAPQAGRRALAAGLLVPALVLGLTLVIGGLGLGDVKVLCPLSAVLGWHGWGTVLLGLALAWCLAGSVALVALLTGRARRDTPLPLGPFLGLGTLLAVLAV